MSIQLPIPATFVIDDRLIIAAAAVLGFIVFIILVGGRIWRAARSAASQASGARIRVVLSTCGPIILALLLAFVAAVIWSRVGIQKSIQASIEGVSIQADGAAGVFAFVYFGALTFLGKIVPHEPQPAQSAIPLVRTTPAKPFPPVPRDDST